MRRYLLGGLLMLSWAADAQAGGWGSVHRHVRPTGSCGAAREVLSSHYWIGAKTATGERFNPHGLTAASHDYPLGTVIAATNPKNGKRCTVTINDRGPYGMARQTGVKVDFALGAARCLGMTSAQYICVP